MMPLLDVWGELLKNSVKANFAEFISPLKNPSSPLPGLLQGKEKPAIAVFRNVPSAVSL
jgi:hypothetical protein